jgi:sugar phosphate permease
LSAFGENGWRVCWIAFAGITALLAAGALILLRNRPSEKGLMPVGADTADSQTVPGSKPAGLQWGRVYLSPVVWHLGAVYVAFGFSYIIYMTFFFEYLIAEGGYSDQAAGNLFMVMGCCSLFCGLIWGTASDAIGRRAAMVIVYLIQAASFGLFAVWPAPAGFTISAVLFGLTAWSIPAIVAASCGDLLGARLAPAALGFVTLFFGIGQALGPTVAGAMGDFGGSLKSAFLLAAGVALVGAIGAALLRKLSAPQPSAQ